MATGKKKIADLEDEILRLLSESTGSLLDDMHLVNTLQDSKTISEEVTQQLQARRFLQAVLLYLFCRGRERPDCHGVVAGEQQTLRISY